MMFFLKRIYLFLTVAILFASVSSIYGQNTVKPENKKTVLVVSSYGIGQEWSTNAARSLQHIIEQSDTNYRVVVEYFNSEKHNSYLEARFGMQGVLFNALRQGSFPSLIIYIGEEAWMVYKSMTLRAWSKIPILLSGVSDKIISNYSAFFSGTHFPDSLIVPVTEAPDTMQHFTAVTHTPDYRATIDVLRKINPTAKEFTFVSNGNFSDVFLEKRFREALKEFPDYNINVLYDDVQNNLTDSIFEHLENLDKSNIILTNTWFSKIADIKKISPHLNKHFPDLIGAPIATFMDQSPSDSSIIGGMVPPIDSIISYTYQYALRILKGEKPETLPHISVENRLILNHTALIYRKLFKNTEKMYDVIYINPAPVFFVRNSRIIFTSLIVLVITALLLGWNNRSNKYGIETRVALERYKKLSEEFQIVYDNMPIGIALFNNEGDLIRSNPEALKLEKLMLKQKNNDRSILKLYNSPFLNAENIQKLSDKEDFSILTPFIKGPGEEAFYRIIFKNIEEVILVAIFDIASTVRERLKREEMSSLFEFAMEKSMLGVAEYNLLDGTGFATDRWHSNIRKQPDSPFTDIYKFVVEEDRLRIESFIEEAKKGEKDLFVDSVRIDSPFRQQWLRYVIKVMEYFPENNRIIVSELNWNIDQQKEREKEIQVALKKAKESDLMKSGFIANMGLEITTPLNAIVGFSTLLYESDNPEEKVTLNAQIEKNNDLLLKTIVNIIDITKIESDSVEFKYAEVDLKILFREIEMLTQRRVGDDINVTVEEKGKRHIILADRERLYQIITCFTSNAEKHTVKGCIKLGYAISGHQLYVYVTDTGTGMPIDIQASIQSVFNNSRNFENGRGFGLHIAKSLVSKMGGEIGFQSELGMGSTFWFKININSVDNET